MGEREGGGGGDNGRQREGERGTQFEAPICPSTVDLRVWSSTTLQVEQKSFPPDSCVVVGNFCCFSPGVTLVDALGFRNFAMMELELILSCQSRPTNERLTLYLLLLPGEGHHSLRPTPSYSTFLHF